ncbi:MAG: sortase family protein [Anaerocolumna sp.]|nr:sortase family protein [Anaerocolumna sp.]
MVKSSFLQSPFYSEKAVPAYKESPASVLITEPYESIKSADRLADNTETKLMEILQKKYKLTSNETNSLNPLYKERPEFGENFGSLSFPSLDLTLPVYEGTEDSELSKGVGHYADSVLPGEADNCVLSGHRDTVFSDLSKLKKGDTILVTTAAGSFTYRIQKFRIVDKEDTTVIVPKPQATLTLTTCYPFTYIGPAPQRFIISAYLTDSENPTD